MNKNNLWNNILLLMEKELNPHIFKNYLKDTRQLDINNDKLTVEVSSKFHKEYLNSHLVNKIKSSLSQLLNKDISILFKIAKENKLNVPAVPKEKLKEKTVNEKEINDTKKLSANLNLKFSFENFVVGASNQFAHAACLSVAKSPSKTYNPLFIYSGAGLGKTHLINAIGDRIIETNSHLSVLYIPGDKFINDLIHSLQNGKMDSFRAKYRKIDVLLMDDVQFIAGKPATQEEFFHTFNTLYMNGKQIVLTSDKPPKEIPLLEERLRSRFQSGLLADIAFPDLETREAILYKKCEVEKVKIPPEVINYIAKKIKHSIRDLEGAFVKLVALTTLMNQEINLELAKKAVKDMIKENVKKGTTLDTIQQTVGDYYGIDKKQLCSKRRIREILIPRQVAMYIAREITNASTTEIGRSFGSKDHSTAIHAIEKIRNLRKMDNNLNASIEKIIKDLRMENM
ncbi:MAG: chromosomal replication initiator protein DnaA [Spirochaetes bacterium]|nr:chromosomal replication initiator protein DnaA [Spirochaetota bacterium]